MGWVGWDLCVGLLYEHCFAVLIIEPINSQESRKYSVEVDRQLGLLVSPEKEMVRTSFKDVLFKAAKLLHIYVLQN